MKGIVYILIGTGKSISELNLAIKSVLKNSNLDIPIKVYWSGFKPPVPKGVDLIEVEPTIIRGSQRLAHRLIKARLYRNPPFAKTLFLDTDTICVGSLEGVFDKCDEYVRGIPDGRVPNPNDMIKWSFTGGDYKKCGTEIFGAEYMIAQDKPTAWNVGVFPLSRKMASTFSRDFLELTEFFAFKMIGELYDAYKRIFDEQIPLNYCLWKNDVPTLDMDTKWNITKTKLPIFYSKDSRILHIRLKTKKCFDLVSRYISLEDL